jgi:hypothetical protein
MHDPIPRGSPVEPRLVQTRALEVGGEHTVALARRGGRRRCPMSRHARLTPSPLGPSSLVAVSVRKSGSDRDRDRPGRNSRPSPRRGPGTSRQRGESACPVGKVGSSSAMRWTFQRLSYFIPAPRVMLIYLGALLFSAPQHYRTCLHDSLSSSEPVAVALGRDASLRSGREGQGTRGGAGSGSAGRGRHQGPFTPQVGAMISQPLVLKET